MGWDKRSFFVTFVSFVGNIFFVASLFRRGPVEGAAVLPKPFTATKISVNGSIDVAVLPGDGENGRVSENENRYFYG